MNRRNFLQSGSVLSATLAFAKAGRLFSEVTALDRWRTFQVTTRVEVLKTSGTTRIWVPAALISETPFQKTLANTFTCEGGTAKIVESKTDVLGIIAAEFPAGVRPILTVTSRIATKDCAVDLTVRGTAPKESRVELEHFLRPTKFLPTDGIVKATASEITRGTNTDSKRAVRWAGARGGPPRARRLWHPRRQVRNGIQEPRCFVRESDESATLPRRGLPWGLRLGAC